MKGREVPCKYGNYGKGGVEKKLRCAVNIAWGTFAEQTQLSNQNK